MPHRDGDHGLASSEFVYFDVDARQVARIIFGQDAAEHAGSKSFTLHRQKFDGVFLTVTHARLHADAAAIFSQLGEDVGQRFDTKPRPATVALEHERVRESDAVVGADVDKDAVAFSVKVFVDDSVLTELAHPNPSLPVRQ